MEFFGFDEVDEELGFALEGAGGLKLGVGGAGGLAFSMSAVFNLNNALPDLPRMAGR